MVRSVFTSLLLVCAGSAGANTAAVQASNPKLRLDQKAVAERVLKDSPQAKIDNLTSELARLEYATALSRLDWSLTFTGGINRDETEQLTGGIIDRTDSLVTSVKLEKPLLTGTNVSLEYARNSNQFDFATGSTPTFNNSLTSDSLTLQLSQSLWNNSFGRGTRAEVNAAEKALEQARLQRLVSLQETVLRGIRLYWETFTARRNFEESVAARDRYVKLVESVRRKNSFGYTNPGELAQTEAELLAREATVKTESLNYLSKMDELKNFLNVPEATEVDVVASLDVPALPTLPATSIEGLRSYRIQELRLKSSELREVAAKSRSGPSLALVAELEANGVNDQASDSFNEMIAQDNPRAYVGLLLTHQFGSGVQSERALNAKLNKQIASLNRDTEVRKLAERESFLKRQVQATYANALTSQNQKDFRQKAVQELQRSFNQGRTDISLLIEALNRYSASEVNYAVTLGQYQIALNEWAAFRDELIPSQLEDK